MSILLSSSPSAFFPVYNPFYYVGISTNVLQSNFKYLIDIYSGTTTGGTLLASYKVFPQPTTGLLVFSPSRLLESNVSYDIESAPSTTLSYNLPPTLLRNSYASNSQTKYTISFGEEYGPYQFNFVDNTLVGGPSGKIGFYVTGSTPGPVFKIGDSVTVTQAPGYTFSQYNGTHTVLSATSTAVYIDVNIQGSTPPEPGYITYADNSNAVLTGLTITSGVGAFNGTLQFQTKPFWSADNYRTNQTTPVPFLTDGVTSGQTFRSLSGLSTLSYIVPDNTDPFGTPTKVRVQVYNSTGSTLNVYTLNSSTNAVNTAANNINFIGSGPWNINNYTLTQVSGSTAPIHSDTLYYDIWLSNAAGLPVTQAMRFYMDDTCYKFDEKRLMWLNSLGGWDYFSFNLVSKKTLSSTKKYFDKPLAYNYGNADRGKTVLNTENKHSMSVTSDWVDENTYAWLVSSLMVSNEVYEIQTYSDNTMRAVPININDNSKEYLQKKVKKNFNISFEYDYAFEYNGKRN